MLSIEKAAQAWCTPETSHIVMDEKLAYAFAEIIEDIWTKPWLGNATTNELLEELDARNVLGKEYTEKLRQIMDLNYRTVDPK